MDDEAVNGFGIICVISGVVGLAIAVVAIVRQLEADMKQRGRPATNLEIFETALAALVMGGIYSAVLVTLPLTLLAVLCNRLFGWP